ncbi:uncharacterized protein LOC112177326 isoform X4 [Rosa chinensis]|uniref:uncharacterized protein LOC112177326 isoform X4 n=1 Tax=Rosa chinensis TaxID=74649 RepID=UPI001AD8D9BD|nr:uncharacterized protein LOC112177326 isoform X4 [Rosa chinensis]
MGNWGYIDKNRVSFSTVGQSSNKCQNCKGSLRTSPKKRRGWLPFRLMVLCLWKTLASASMPSRVYLGLTCSLLEQERDLEGAAAKHKRKQASSNFEQTSSIDGSNMFRLNILVKRITERKWHQRSFYCWDTRQSDSGTL